MKNFLTTFTNAIIILEVIKEIPGVKIGENQMMENEVEINYWRSIQNEVDEVLEKLQGIILVLHDSMEFTQFIDFLQKIQSNHFTNVLYISLTRSHDYIRHAMELKPFDRKLIYVFDCVSGFAFPTEDHNDNCLYHKPPQDLAQLKEIIKYGIEKSNPEIIVLDSLSQFVNFSQSTDKELHDLSLFLQTLKDDTLNIRQKTVLLLYDTKLSSSRILPKMMIDMILKIEIIKKKTLNGKHKLLLNYQENQIHYPI